ncbi:hypothetical protein TCAL_01774 [Tigriopus californicus]|uniref:CUB domain-containing protein n=1 Tax=Tigriopus californicus TaxID=6832 RepID=A0A553N8G1_TIGCA|nr:uncharacterized protein LOC131884885 [Tigriopus californicus]TRY61732.1 hypothetical protein TCAL_01774 [Tigriopus californicus]|eukprot:TCALIF_01774-PA protein Name:"Protein of unknown function" AED:0.00 eAED:0.00 QI:32/1/1/1/0.8/0.66/6/72/445
MKDLSTLIHLTCLLFLASIALAAENLTKSTSILGSARDKRFLGLFNLIQFANTQCNASATSELSGVCYTQSECQSFGGRAAGDCALGFGVCCVFEYDCNSLRPAPRDVFYFQNANFPNDQSDPSMCLFGISILNANICQLRLDFEEFDLDSGSSLTSPCDRDSLEILSTGMSDLGMGKLCGNNQDQHLYIPVINDRSQPMIRIMTEDRMLNVSQPYKYRIRVTQIDCNSKDPLMNALKAPDNCLQYFVERRGTIQSFNWRPDLPRVYQKNQNYAICFRREPSDCQMSLKRAQNAPAFSTSVGQATGYTKFCAVDNGCGFEECSKALTGIIGSVTLDHLQINAFHRSSAMPATPVQGKSEYEASAFFCGVGLGADTPGIGDGEDIRDGVIVQSKGPFVLRFFTDDENGQPNTPTVPTPGPQKINELGFSIDYQIMGNCQNLDIGIL